MPERGSCNGRIDRETAIPVTGRDSVFVFQRNGAGGLGGISFMKPIAAENEKIMPTSLILVVDDEPAVLHSTKLVLQSEGYTVAGAATSKEALQLLGALSFDLLLLDCIPGNDRIEQEARRVNPRMKIAICSGSPDLGARPPADDVIQEPMPAPEFLGRVARLLHPSNAA